MLRRLNHILINLLVSVMFCDYDYKETNLSFGHYRNYSLKSNVLTMDRAAGSGIELNQPPSDLEVFTRPDGTKFYTRDGGSN